MRQMIRRFDAFLGRTEGIFQFCDDPDCLLRLQRWRLRRPLILDGAQVGARSEVIQIHLWNDHLPPIPPGGPSLSWAIVLRRRFEKSLCRAAEWIACRPEMARAKAVGGVTALLAGGDRASGVELMRRLGFQVLPYHRPLGRFGEFLENLYSWWLLWAYNPGSLQHRRFLGIRRTEIWMPMDDFLRRFARGSCNSRDRFGVKGK